MTEVIASRDNERVKRACKLRDSGARRAAEGRFLAEGLRLCTDLAQRLPPEEVYCTQKLLDAHPELAALGGRHFLVSDAVAAKLSDTKAPQGLFCVFPRRTKTLEAVRGGGRGLAERRRRGWRAAVAFQGGVAMGGADTARSRFG